jgi:type VI secretion system secreted protein Hcp
MITTFLQLDGVEGESIALFHEGDIELIDWDWGVSNTAPLELTSNVSTHTKGEDLSITKGIDTASKTLIQKCALGEHIPKGRLTCEKNEGTDDKFTYLIIEFEDMKVMSVKADKGGENIKTESVVFKYSKFKISYVKQLNTGASDISGYMDFGFDLPHHVVY